MGHKVYAWGGAGRRIVGGLLLTLALAGAAHAEDEALTLGSYELGLGLRLGDTGATLGGYATARYDNPAGAAPRASLDHLSLMLWWEGEGRFKFFSEADMEQGLATRHDADDGERFFSLERAYVDYAASDTLTLRAGKFLTPVGRWNLVHADPLVWTTSRPMVTEQVFPDLTTGLMALGAVSVADRDVDYMVYLATGNGVRRKPEEDPFSSARGLRFNLPVTSSLQVGMSAVEFEQESSVDERKRLGGLDFQWLQRGWEITGEAVYRSSSTGPERTERGGYLQVVMPLTERLHAIARAEDFRFAEADDSTHLYLAGLNYRYTRALSLKAEFVSGSHLPDTQPRGFIASLSVLF